MLVVTLGGAVIYGYLWFTLILVKNRFQIKIHFSISLLIYDLQSED